MRTFAFLRAASLTLLTAAVALFARRAHATIVVNGKAVPAWPRLEPDEPSPGVLFDVVGAPGIKLFPHPSGVVRGLTILVDFSDQTGAYSKAEIEGWLNTRGYGKFGLDGSIRDYFFKQSNGLVDYQNELHGFYRAKKPKSYYQGGTAYERADELWTEVIDALEPIVGDSIAHARQRQDRLLRPRRERRARCDDQAREQVEQRHGLRIAHLRHRRVELEHRLFGRCWPALSDGRRGQRWWGCRRHDERRRRRRACSRRLR